MTLWGPTQFCHWVSLMLERVVTVLDTLEAEGTCVSHFKLKYLGFGNPGHKGFSYLAQDLKSSCQIPGQVLNISASWSSPHPWRQWHRVLPLISGEANKALKDSRVLFSINTVWPVPLAQVWTWLCNYSKCEHYPRDRAQWWKIF